MAADLTIEEFSTAAPMGTRLAGLDLGTKTIGIAVSDPGQNVASPVTTIRRVKFGQDAASLLSLCTTERIGGLVLGLPVNMDGSEGPRCQATRAFVRNLKTLTDLPITLWDERLSTMAVERAMIEADLSRRKRAERVDAAAAAYILQGALDRLATLRRQRV
ncbi:Holliday junction resolvase RuvX [Afifella sp. H1R]|uniref:Holliday junction resolvase RuvX n=1 Tax=Afifella sp. H1R TaxID=2908841 RepID=UPI001EFFFE2B|nr:Holliday junction resolvase RuvX [Afifella sp. H1R]MCF1502780.1 Holliday junction resolvase RuvX [Afifella sp. H1R]